MEILNPRQQSKWVIDYPMRNILLDNLFLFSPKANEEMDNLFLFSPKANEEMDNLFLFSPKANEEMDNLFLFSPKEELMLNIKGKGRPRGGHTFLGEKIELHISNC